MNKGHWLWKENLHDQIESIATRPSADPFLFLGVTILARRQFPDYPLGKLFTTARIGQAVDNGDSPLDRSRANPNFDFKKWFARTGFNDESASLFKRIFQSACIEANLAIEARGERWWSQYRHLHLPVRKNAR